MFDDLPARRNLERHRERAVGCPALSTCEIVIDAETIHTVHRNRAWARLIVHFEELLTWRELERESGADNFRVQVRLVDLRRVHGWDGVAPPRHARTVGPCLTEREQHAL